MKLLADENFPRPAVTALRERGLDVSWVAETTPGASDHEVLAECIRARRTLLTFDKDFGELAYYQGLPSECGVILFRITPQNPEEVAALAVAALESRPSWTGCFSVVTRKSIRVRRLPPPRADAPGSRT
jgi:predicted nuclease of predicted toxin-antitoxin system